MASRFYLCPVVGSGTESDPFRAKASDYGVAHAALIPTNALGIPRFPWCVVVVTASDFSALDADVDFDAWPGVSLDTTVAQLTANQRSRLAGALSKRGIDASDVVGQTTLRQILRRVMRLLEPTAAENLLGAG